MSEAPQPTPEQAEALYLSQQYGQAVAHYLTSVQGEALRVAQGKDKEIRRELVVNGRHAVLRIERGADSYSVRTMLMIEDGKDPQIVWDIRATCEFQPSVGCFVYKDFGGVVRKNDVLYEPRADQSKDLLVLQELYRQSKDGLRNYTNAAPAQRQRIEEMAQSLRPMYELNMQTHRYTRVPRPPTQ